MKIGSIGYGTCQGLGVLLKDFYDHGIVTDVLRVNHPHRINHHWYRGPVTDLRNFDGKLARAFVDQMDAMFFFETPFDVRLFEYCRETGTPSILMPMYECTPRLTYQPDLIINPSLLDQTHYERGEYIQVPVPDWVTWKRRERARVFVHNAGHGGLAGRNGTQELLEAMQYVEAPIRLIVRTQAPLGVPIHDARISVRVGTFSREELYSEGDVFIFPEKFNGLSLPLQEAKASGMLIMATDRFPINTWTERDSLIPTSGTVPLKLPAKIVAADAVHPHDIAETIDRWYDRDITDASEAGKRFGERMSWKYLGNYYKRAIAQAMVNHGSKATN